MPIVNVTCASEVASILVPAEATLREKMSVALSVVEKPLTPEQLTLRFFVHTFWAPLAPVEVEIFGHAYLERLPGLDLRARSIAQIFHDFTATDVGCWIMLGMVGYSSWPRDAGVESAGR